MKYLAIFSAKSRLEDQLMPKISSKVQHIRLRRRELADQFNVAQDMENIEETCVPSYLHGNVLAASVAWWRLFAAEAFYRKYAHKGQVLDFGAASGELAHLLPSSTSYEFVEANDKMAISLQRSRLTAVRRSLETLPSNQYAAIFALDSLEHNEDVSRIVELLVESLRVGGVMIISGPTENFLYRMGRRIAGFNGHYHKTTIYEIEKIVGKKLSLVRQRILPFGVPLFSISCWRKK